MTIVCKTERLIIRHCRISDAEFFVRLLNEKAFIRYIADKNVRTIDDGINHINNGPISSYQQYGFGLNIVTLKETNVPIGICGLIKRDELDYPDLGYAFLSDFCGQGYAYEAANVVLQEEVAKHSLNVVLAVTLPDNLSSNRLLQKIGFKLTGTIELYGSQNNLYAHNKND